MSIDVVLSKYEIFALAVASARTVYMDVLDTGLNQVLLGAVHKAMDDIDADNDTNVPDDIVFHVTLTNEQAASLMAGISLNALVLLDAHDSQEMLAHLMNVGDRVSNRLWGTNY